MLKKNPIPNYRLHLNDLTAFRYNIDLSAVKIHETPAHTPNSEDVNRGGDVRGASVNSRRLRVAQLYSRSHCEIQILSCIFSTTLLTEVTVLHK